MKQQQPVNKTQSPYHDPAYDFRVIAEFTQRFPSLQFHWFTRHTSDTTDGLIAETLHAIQFRTDRAGLRKFGIPVPRHGQLHGSDYRPGHGPPIWSWHIDARCRLPYVVHTWLEDSGRRCLPESHPLSWLVPSRIETTSFDGDLDSILWSDVLKAA